MDDGRRNSSDRRGGFDLLPSLCSQRPLSFQILFFSRPSSPSLWASSPLRASALLSFLSSSTNERVRSPLFSSSFLSSSLSLTPRFSPSFLYQWSPTTTRSVYRSHSSFSLHSLSSPSLTTSSSFRLKSKTLSGTSSNEFTTTLARAETGSR